MTKEKFNVNDWLPADGSNKGMNTENEQRGKQPVTHQANKGETDLELIVSRIEASCTDITGHYADWRNIGFALVDELGESGRDYFHRISRLYPKYNQTESNKQYDQCLKSQGHGITIKTLYHLAKQAGVEIGRRENDAQDLSDLKKTDRYKPESAVSGAEHPSPERIELPTLPDSVYTNLPDYLQKVVARCLTNEERDILLLGAIVTLSSCLPNVFGMYDETRVCPNMFLYVTAQASAGKGRLVHCKRLVNPVHWAFRKESQALKAQYEIDMREYNLLKLKDFNMEKPRKPPEKLLIIPANNSTTGVFQLLSDNEGCGLIFETEGDTLAQAFKSDYGNYSDGFRKAFHHETISYYRRTDREYVDIDRPCLSVVLSSTPRQVTSLIPGTENGLFSRFIFYHMNIKPFWKRVFSVKRDNSLDMYFDQLGQEFFHLYQELKENPGIEFSLTLEQEEQFHVFFTQVQEKYLVLQGMDYLATVRRLGLIAFRMAMVLTMLRIMETQDFSPRQVCRDQDFQTVLSMISILVKHSSYVYSQLPEEVEPAKPKDRKEQLLEMLPEKFTHQDLAKMAKSMAIPLSTANRYMAVFCDRGLIRRDNHGIYTNLTLGSAGLRPPFK